jgi:hypothetical protein
MKTMRIMTTIMVTVWKTKDRSMISGLHVHYHHLKASAVHGWMEDQMNVITMIGLLTCRLSDEDCGLHPRGLLR